MRLVHYNFRPEERKKDKLRETERERGSERETEKERKKENILSDNIIQL